jgi:hypothetical protein
MSAKQKRFLFAGPSLYRAMTLRKPLLQDFVVLPPIKRGDLQRVIASSDGATGVLALADGLFHLNNLAVGHAEIRAALERGWSVWGLSSMGAIRACEMRHMGMRGFGRVYELYAEDEDFRDDEVALLHESHPPYRAVSEPLVHLRCGLDDLHARQVIGDADRREILEHLMGLWFGERTVSLVSELLCQRVPERKSEILEWARSFNQYQLKSLDLLHFLEQRPWLPEGELARDR